MRGAGAHGFFEAYGTIGDEPANKYTCQAQQTGKTYVCSFSTVIHGGHSPETLRDPRFLPSLHRRLGFGGEITLGLFYQRSKFPDLVHAKPDPVTNRQD